MSPAIFVGAVGCLLRVASGVSVARVGGVNVSKVRFSSAAAGVQSRPGVSPKPDALGTWPHDQLSGILRLKGVSTSGCAFSAMALPAPRGTDFGVSSTDSSTTASCARKRSNSHSEYKATISGGCTVGEVTDPAAMDLAYVPHLSHVWRSHDPDREAHIFAPPCMVPATTQLRQSISSSRVQFVEGRLQFCLQQAFLQGHDLSFHGGTDCNMVLEQLFCAQATSSKSTGKSCNPAAISRCGVHAVIRPTLAQDQRHQKHSTTCKQHAQRGLPNALHDMQVTRARRLATKVSTVTVITQL